MSSTQPSKSLYVLPSLLEQLARDDYDSEELEELAEEAVPRFDLMGLADVLIQRQEAGRRLDPSDPDYHAQLLGLEDEAGFFKQLFGVWWSSYKPKHFEPKLRAARYA